MFSRISTPNYLQTKTPYYDDYASLHPLYDRMAFRAPLVLVGPKGVGKSLSVRAWASKNKVPVVTCDCSEDIRRSNLIGSFVLRADQTPFLLGPIPTAYEVANETGKCILVFEEINSLAPQMQKVLNPMLDFRARVEVPEVESVFRLQPEKQLWIVGTMNTSDYGGVFRLNEDLVSRFRFLRTGYPAQANEKEVLVKARVTTGEIPQMIYQHALTLARETRQKNASVEYALSTRDLVQFIEDVEILGIKAALRLLGCKFEDQDREWFFKRVESIFGVPRAEIT